MKIVAASSDSIELTQHAGDLHPSNSPKLNKSNLFSEKVAPRLTSFAATNPIGAAVTGLAILLFAATSGSVAVAFAGPLGAVCFAAIPVGLVLLTQGVRAYRANKIPDFPKTQAIQKLESVKNLEMLLRPVIDQAFADLPRCIAIEMSRLPRITDDVVQHYNTTIEQLQRDQAQTASMLSLHKVFDGIKSLTDQHWDLHDRYLNAENFNSCARKLILEKLDQFQQQDGLDQLLLTSVVPSSIPAQSVLGISQRESFALNRITECFIRECLESKSSLSLKHDSLEEELIKSRSGAERKKAYISTCDAMADSVKVLYREFDRFVRRAGELPDMNRVQHILMNLGDSRVKLDEQARQSSPSMQAANEWLLRQKTNFNDRINEVFDELPAVSREAFRNALLNTYLQEAGNLKTAWVQDLTAFSGAHYQLEQIRQNENKIPPISVDESRLWLKTGLDGLREVIMSNDFSDLRDALDDNRSGTPLTDTRLREHIQNLAGSEMLNNLRDEHRAAVLDVLAAYGEKTVCLLRGYGLQILSGDKYGGLSDTKQVEDGYKGADRLRSALDGWLSAYAPANSINKVDLQENIDSTKDTRFKSQSNSFMNPKRRFIVLSDYHTDSGRGAMAHELAHALDAALAMQLNLLLGDRLVSKPWYFSDLYTNIQVEYKKIKEKRQGITTDAHKNARELLAESAAAYLSLSHGFERTYAKPRNAIKSRDNLWKQHPVIAQFLDEVLRAPDKVFRAAATPPLRRGHP